MNNISTHAPLAGRDGLEVGQLALRQISTHAPLAGRDCQPGKTIAQKGISTHAPLAGRDVTDRQVSNIPNDFNPRAPCGARPHRVPEDLRLHQEFQPTRPLRGATSKPAWWGSKQEISTHAPLAGRDENNQIQHSNIKISTHAPLAGRDEKIWHLYPADPDFNPRAPCGARLVGLLESTDVMYFNPRAPCGARLR